jgi:hypothetical protein
VAAYKVQVSCLECPVYPIYFADVLAVSSRTHLAQSQLRKHCGTFLGETWPPLFLMDDALCTPSGVGVSVVQG